MIATDCPERERLQAYSLGRLPDGDSEEISVHIQHCGQCAAELETFDDRGDTLIGQLRAAADNPFAQESGLTAAVERAKNVPIAAPEPNRSFACEMLGEYEVLEEIGRGGMGRVYRARHTKLSRTVAIKVLPQGKLIDEASAARFEREMRAIGGLDHPNVVHAYDAREIDGVPVLVMEFVDGLDLGELSRRLGPLRPADACELVRQAALGLQYAHENGLVHRDVKPSNLMLDRRGRVRLLDLGLARLLGDPAGEAFTAAGQAMGTADYIAPEQVIDSRSADIRSDVYSLGCTFFQLLTGRAPYARLGSGGGMDKLYAHVHQPFPTLALLAPGAPERLEAILAKMTAKDLAERFATPGEVAEALSPQAAGAELGGLIELAERTPPAEDRSRSIGLKPPLQTKPVLRKPRWLWPLAVACSLGMFGLGFAAGVIVTVHKDGKATRVEVPSGADVAISAAGDVDVRLDGEQAPAESTAAAPAARGPTGLWQAYGVTNKPVSDLTATFLEVLGLQVIPIDREDFRGRNLLVDISGGLKIVSRQKHGPSHLLESDIILGLDGVAVRSLAELDAAVATSVAGFTAEGPRWVRFVVLRSGDLDKKSVELETSARRMLKQVQARGDGSVRVVEPNLEEILGEQMAKLPADDASGYGAEYGSSGGYGEGYGSMYGDGAYDSDPYGGDPYGGGYGEGYGGDGYGSAGGGSGEEAYSDGYGGGSTDGPFYEPRLLGRWVVEKGIAGGEAMDFDEQMLMTFNRDSYERWMGPHLERMGHYALDRYVEPYRITLIRRDANFSETYTVEAEGIYRFEDDGRLMIALHPGSGKRPTDFESDPGDPQSQVLTLRRIDAEKVPIDAAGDR